jgi:hypothetical protein
MHIHVMHTVISLHQAYLTQARKAWSFNEEYGRETSYLFDDQLIHFQEISVKYLDILSSTTRF